MKQITIYDLLPLLKKGWVAYDKRGGWHWFNDCPKRGCYWYGRFIMSIKTSLCCFNIKPFDGDWKDSLIKVEHKEEE